MGAFQMESYVRGYYTAFTHARIHVLVYTNCLLSKNIPVLNFCQVGNWRKTYTGENF